MSNFTAAVSRLYEHQNNREPNSVELSQTDALAVFASMLSFGFPRGSKSQELLAEAVQALKAGHELAAFSAAHPSLTGIIAEYS